MTLGDSRTAWNEWQPTVLATLRADPTGTGTGWTLLNGGVGGESIAVAQDAIDSRLATYYTTGNVTTVLLNWGVVGMGTQPEAELKSDYLYIIDAVHTKWPGAHIYLARPWRQGYDTQSAELATWIADIQAARSTFVSLGPDESLVIKPPDDGATNTTDGVHYSTAGAALWADAWLTALGY